MEQRFSSNREERPCLCSGGDVAPATHGPLPCCPWDRKTGARSHSLTRVQSRCRARPKQHTPETDKAVRVSSITPRNSGC